MRDTQRRGSQLDKLTESEVPSPAAGSPYQHVGRTWAGKFRDAFRGLADSMRGQSSFSVHWIIAVLVIICGVVFRVSRVEWCLLVLCITFVVALEVINSAIETLAKAVDERFNPQIGRALDMASGAVLVGSLGAAIVGLIIFLYRLYVMVT